VAGLPAARPTELPPPDETTDLVLLAFFSYKFDISLDYMSYGFCLQRLVYFFQSMNEVCMIHS
jgi:hypothetical protein